MHRTHGLSHLPEYSVWSAMIQRSTNSSNKQWPDYGARGITVCDTWMDFTNFIYDMGPRPSPEYSIDRINNNGNYEPSNCRWGTDAQQATNKRNNRAITFNNQTKTLSQWAKEIGIHPTGLNARISKWGIEKALTTPKQQEYVHR